jgi:hypothetical protein
MPTEILTSTFDGYTLGEARAKVLRKLRVNDTTRYSPTSGTADYDWIDDALNISQRKFVTKTKCLRTYGIIQLKNGYRTYRAPKGFIDIMSAYLFKGSYSNGYVELQIKTIAELNDEVSDWRTDTDDDVQVVYIDRFFGTDAVLGVYPIPTADGATTFFTSTTGTQYDWACPLYAYSHDYGIIVKTDGTDKYILADSGAGVVADLAIGDGNILLEYYRMPMDLSEEDQNLEIPYAYQDVVIEDAVAELLENNPEDSAEFKRSVRFEQKTDKSIAEYKRDTKPPLSGREMRVRTAVEGWQKNMEWRKGMF